MEEKLFREKSMARISSPEALNDYLRVTNPAVWLILLAVIVLLAGMLIWSSVASISSFVPGSAKVENGSMRITFDDEQLAQNVESGMTVVAGESESRINSIGTDADGSMFASASTDLPDGNYAVRVVFRRTRVLSLLFN